MKTKIKPVVAVALLLLNLGLAQADAGSCMARSGPTVPPLVELYTSEGCNSCPPADRWLSGLKARRPDAIAAAFHVDYWDRLGWKDRFASPAYTERQQQTQAWSGARFAYTPQIIVNGRDWHGGSELPAPSPAGVALVLQRHDGDKVSVDLRPLSGSPAKVQLWWAAVEDGHQSQVKAGENQGSLLRHDDVVRDYARLPAGGPEQSWQVKLAPAEAGHARRLVVVAVDPSNGRVLQAVELGC
ncbi:thioredoxin family protein [Pelomonas sp. KK5]|uniref:DUF1223 domain-containing protein n=1 Tax=Pelomonas sp. KK5 TaxID=1855730 RepID=UPI001301F065|nr:DUF1223 domain-containing protein [Pelomonas sp. KK5]